MVLSLCEVEGAVLFGGPKMGSKFRELPICGHDKTPWFLVGNGGMDPCDSPLKSPIVVPKTQSSIPY